MNTYDDAAIFFFVTILRFQAYVVTCICAFYTGTDAMKSLCLGGKFSPQNCAVGWTDFVPKSLLQKKILIEVWVMMVTDTDQSKSELRFFFKKTLASLS